MQVFKIIKGFSNHDLSSYTRLDQSDFTHNNGYQLMGKCLTLNEAMYLFFNWTLYDME